MPSLLEASELVSKVTQYHPDTYELFISPPIYDNGVCNHEIYAFHKEIKSHFIYKDAAANGYWRELESPPNWFGNSFPFKDDFSEDEIGLAMKFIESI